MALRRWWGAAAVLLGLCTALVFVPGLSNEFTWDDNGLIRTNENIQRPEHYREALTTHFWNVSTDAVESNQTYDHLYRPLVTLAYIVQFRLFGLNAIGYRVVSLALHVLCCILAFFWIARRLPGPRDAHRLAAVTLGAAIFALHPSRVESVSWISGSTELWMCAFVLLAARAFDSDRGWLAGCLIVVALFAKETAVVAVPLLLTDRFLIRNRLDRAATIGLALPALIAVAVRLALVNVDLPAGTTSGAAARALASIGLYGREILSPWNPTAFPGMRAYDCVRGEHIPVGWWVAGLVIVTATVALGAVAYRSERWRPALADALWLTVPLIPVANWIDLGSRNLIADRFLYLPMLGVAALTARGLAALLARSPAIGRIAVGAVGLIVVGFAIVTSLHSRVYGSSSSFWEYEAQRNPDNPFALHAVGTARVTAGLRRSGFERLERAQIVAAQTCVHADQVRAAKDLVWALAVNTGPEDREALLNLQTTLKRSAKDGLVAHAGPPPWSLQLSAEERDETVEDALHFGLPLATVKARLGLIEEATQLLTESRRSESRPHPQSEALRIRLVAANGRVRTALIELAKAHRVADSDGLTSVLATLHETFKQAHVAPSAESSLASYALGFGPPTDSVRDLDDQARLILTALRAYETNQAVDVESLAPYAADHDELPRFLGLARKQAEVRKLDRQLVGQ